MGLKNNLDEILNKDIAINKLFGIKEFMAGILDDAPDLSSIAIFDESGTLLYYSDSAVLLKGETLDKKAGRPNVKCEASATTILFELTGPSDVRRGTIALSLNEQRIYATVRSMALDSGTVILISILAIFDFLFFIVSYTITLPIKNAINDINDSNRSGFIDTPIRRTSINFIDHLLDDFERFRYRFRDDLLKLNTISKSFFKSAHCKDEVESPTHDTFEKFKMPLNRFRQAGILVSRQISLQSPVLIRPAIFLFVFSESLSISFLPIYAESLYTPFFSFSKEVVMGLPISLFMLFTAIILPPAGALADRIGIKKIFILGAIINCIGLFLTGIAVDIFTLLIYRSLTGIGFGMVYMTTQQYIVNTTSLDNRAEGMAIFLSAFYGGTLCGSAVGGMLADRIGFRSIFFIGAGMAVLSICFILKFIAEKPEGKSEEMTAPAPQSLFKTLVVSFPSPRRIITLFSDKRFAALVFLQAIPNKFCLIGFVYYLGPVFLNSLNIRHSDIGKYIMCYSLIMILISQSASKWSDRKGNMLACINIGGIISGVAFLPFFFIPGAFAVAFGIIVLGLAHCFTVSNQAKLALNIRAVKEVGSGPGLGIYRLAERFGNVLAPIILGILITTIGIEMTVGLMGVYMILSSVVFSLIYKYSKRT